MENRYDQAVEITYTSTTYLATIGSSIKSIDSRPNQSIVVTGPKKNSELFL